MSRAVVFAYSSVGCECVRALLENGADIPLLYTHEDDPGEERWFDSVPELARRSGINAVTHEPSPDEVRAAAPDVIFSFYYRSMISMDVLDIAPLGAFNMHGSLLPKYRGRACVNWAVLNGETEAGVTLHRMTAKPDRGNIIDQYAVPIGEDDTSHDVFKKLIPAAGIVIRRSLAAILAGEAEGAPQDETKASYFGRRRPEDGRIDWSKKASDIKNLVRAVAWPFPGAFSETGGRRLIVHRVRLAERPADVKAGYVISSSPLIVAAGDGALEILSAQWGDERVSDETYAADSVPELKAGMVLL